MAMFLLALCIASSVEGLDISQLQNPGDVLDFAAEIQEKSSESEQDILKTLMGDRAKWHPDALSLLDTVQKRGSHGRRLSGQTYCDGATESECNTQVDDQCQMCKWKYSSCRPTDCSDYDSQSACCANAKNVALGCRWQTGLSGSCVANECDQIIGTYSGLSDNAAKKAACDAQPGCTTFCDASGNDIKCQPGAASDWTCTCSSTFSTCSAATTASGTASASTVNNALAVLTATCTSTDCAKCLGTTSDCSQKKTKVASGGDCFDKCKTLSQCDAETECMFCGKKNSTSCTAAHAVLPSCADITLSATTTTTTGCTAAACTAPQCTAACSALNTRCASTCTGTPSTAYDCKYNSGSGSSGAVRTMGTVMAATIGLVVAVLYRA